MDVLEGFNANTGEQQGYLELTISRLRDVDKRQDEPRRDIATSHKKLTKMFVYERSQDVSVQFVAGKSEKSQVKPLSGASKSAPQPRLKKYIQLNQHRQKQGTALCLSEIIVYTVKWITVCLHVSKLHCCHTSTLQTSSKGMMQFSCFDRYQSC